MRTKKTIRKLSPLARKAATLSREVNGIRKRLDNLTEWIEDNEVERRVALRENEQLRTRITVLTLPDPIEDQAPLFPDDPPEVPPVTRADVERCFRTYSPDADDCLNCANQTCRDAGPVPDLTDPRD